MKKAIHFYFLVILRAFEHLFENHARGFVFSTAVAIVSLGYLFLRLGKDEAVAEIPFVEAAVLGALVVLAMLLIWELFVTPGKLYFEELSERLRLQAILRPSLALFVASPEGEEIVLDGSTCAGWLNI